MKNYLLVLMSLMFLNSNAFALARVSILGGVDYGMDSVSSADGLGGTTTVKSGLGFGGGLLVNLGSIEFGALYVSQSVTVTNSTLNFSSSKSFSAIDIPVMYRIGGVTSFGIGGFYDLPMSSTGTSDYGLTAGPRLGTPGGLFFDVRFNYGLKTGNSKNLIGMIGYSFGK